MEEVADVVERNLLFYDQIKPKRQSESYTVIATLNDVRTRKLIALATGTQASLAVYEDDIEDCHAESLIKRAYKRYLIDAALELATPRSTSVNRLRSEFLQNYGKQELMMFISQFPCGLINRYDGQEPVNEETGAVIVRKPGRGVLRDGKMVYVERDPCLFKLKSWLSSYGMQGKSWYQEFQVRTRMTHLVIGDCEPSSDLNYSKHLNDLASELNNPVRPPMKLDKISMRRDEFVFSANKKPEPVAVICWASTARKPTHNVEYVVDGRKRGLTRNQSNSARDYFKLKSGDYWLRSDLDKVRETFQQG